MTGTLWDLLRGDAAADSTVPPSGLTGHLTVAAAAAMALLLAFALLGAIAADRVAARWSGALAGIATLELGPETDPARATAILLQTPGIRAADPLDTAEIRALLAPWIGDAGSLTSADLPGLIAIEEAPELDRAALARRLEGELPGAIYHRHDDFARGIADAAARLRLLAMGFAALALGVAAVVITLAARASLAMHGRIIETLRLLGARDAYIARAFVRRITLRALTGAALGVVLAVPVILILPAGQGGAALAGLAPASLSGWLTLALIPPGIGILAFLATRRAAFRVLTRLR